MTTFDPDWVVAPGETLLDWLNSMNLPLSIASRYGFEAEEFAGILNGETEITPEIAQKLCNLTHIGAPFWLALEHNFRVGLAAGKTWEP